MQSSYSFPLFRHPSNPNLLPLVHPLLKAQLVCYFASLSRLLFVFAETERNLDSEAKRKPIWASSSFVNCLSRFSVEITSHIFVFKAPPASVSTCFRLRFHLPALPNSFASICVRLFLRLLAAFSTYVHLRLRLGQPVSTSTTTRVISVQLHQPPSPVASEYTSVVAYDDNVDVIALNENQCKVQSALL